MTIRRTLGRTVTLAALVPLFVNPGSSAGAQTADPADIAVAYVRANAAPFGLRPPTCPTCRSRTRCSAATPGSPTSTSSSATGASRSPPASSTSTSLVMAPCSARGTGSSPTSPRPPPGRTQRPPPSAARSRRRQRRRATSASTPTERLVVVDREAGPARETTVSDGGISQAAIPAELVWLPLDSGAVRLAWTVEIDQTDGLHFWVISVDAATGAILRADDRIVHDDIGALAGVVARHADPVVVAPEQTVDDGSSYRVFPIPSESPSDGERALVTNPASATASPFGWHDTDGAAGPRSPAPGATTSTPTPTGTTTTSPMPAPTPTAGPDSTSTSRSTSAAGPSTPATPPSPTSSTGTTSSTTSSTRTASTGRRELPGQQLRPRGGGW